MWLHRIFSKLLICALSLVLVMPVAYGDAANFISGDITDNGWATEHNKELVVGALSEDMSNFQSTIESNAMDPGFVPIEAKLGLAFISGMSMLSNVLKASLFRFVIIFILAMYAFWIMLEAYNLIKTGGDAKKTTQEILKKALFVAAWIVVLEMGPERIFMLVVGPIISLGTYCSDLILNAITSVVGAKLPDTCAAIHAYTVAHSSPDMLMDARATADLICVPTRLSGFFYTAIAAGFKWMLSGIGTNLFTFVIGAVFVVVFVYNMYKFALSALGVIADLALAILMLPFTAINETIGKSSYKGIVGDVFNGFLALFSTESLAVQVSRFVNATIYFVSLSVVIGVCVALMAGVVDVNMYNMTPTMSSGGFWSILLIGMLVAYLANKSSDIAKELGGKIDDKIGQQFGKDATGVVAGTAKTAKNWWAAWRKDKLGK